MINCNCNTGDTSNLICILKEDLKRYHKFPDGHYNNDYDIILPRTTFDQVRISQDKTSDTLTKVIHRLSCAVEKRQYVINEGTNDDILTKTAVKGQLDTLLKVDSVEKDPDNRSSRKVPSEVAVGEIYDIAKDSTTKATEALDILITDDTRISSLETKSANDDVRISTLEIKSANDNARIALLETRVSNLESQVAILTAAIDSINTTLGTGSNTDDGTTDGTDDTTTEGEGTCPC